MARISASGRTTLSPNSRTVVPINTRQVVRDFGTALQFNGSSTLVTRAMTNVSVTKWACAFWVKLHTTTQRHSFVFRGNGNATYPRLYSTSSSNMAVTFQYVMTGQSSQNFSSTTKLDKNNWYHIAAVIDNDSGTSRLYINGTLENSQTPNGGVGVTVGTSSSSMLIGNDTNLGIWLNGKMDNFTLWRGYAPSALEIQKLYLKGVVPGTPEIRYLFDEGSGTTANDSSGNGLNGTITAGTYTTQVPMKSRQSV